MSDCAIPLSDLIDYYDDQQGSYRGHYPARMRRLEAHIPDCQRCQEALRGLARVDKLSRSYFEGDSQSDAWYDSIIAATAVESWPGRSVPLEVPGVSAYQTEGALRAFIRRTVSNRDVLVTRSRFDGDITQPHAQVRITVNIAVRYGATIPTLIESVRDRVWEVISSETDLELTAVDIDVRDIITPAATGGSGEVAQLVNRRKVSNG